MDLRLLEYFLAVYEEKHFTRAAEKLGISQPTLSQQIKILESSAGAQLFQRLGKKVSVTEEGQVLAHHARRIFSELSMAKNEIDELKGLQRGKITIGSSGNHFLLPSIMSFHRQYPTIHLSIVDTTTKETVKKIINNEFDLGIVYLPIKEKQLESQRLFSSEIFLVISADHELSEAPFIDLESIESLPLFLLQKKYSIRQDLDHYCEANGITLNPVIELSNMQSLLQITLSSNGATILPTQFLKNIKDNRVRKIPIANNLPQREIGIVYRKDIFLPYATRTFIHHLLNSQGTSFLEVP